MKKGLSMISVIFAIIIIGILASIAIPKLLATKYDAYAAQAGMEMKNILGELSAYYLKHGRFITDEPNNTSPDVVKKFSKTYEEVWNRDINKWVYHCVTISINEAKDGHSADVRFYEGSGANKNSQYCKVIRESIAYQAFRDGFGTRKDGGNGNTQVGVNFIGSKYSIFKE